SSSFMFPVAGGLGPPQGMIPMQQQGFPMVPVMQPNMPGMMGMNYGSQLPPGPMAMQGGMALGPMPATGMPYMGQASFLGMRPAAPQYSPDMQKQFAEEQQKRFEHQQKFLEEERKRRQFEEQKQKLRLLSSVKPKTGEKSRDDALEAIKGNLDGFSRDAKMHPTPASHAKKPDHPTSSHSAVSVSHSAFPDDEEFSDFIQGPVESPRVVPAATPQAPQPVRPGAEAGQRRSPQAAPQPAPPAPAFPILHAATAQDNGSNESEQEQTKLKPSEVGHKASAASHVHPSVPVTDWDVVGGHERGPTAAEVHKASEQNRAVEECGVGVFPSQDPIQQMMPPWIYNDSLVPELYKKILETTLTPAGIDTAKLYPILMSSGLPRETLGQIWALANRTTPGKLTKEELYAVLAMIAVTQRGMPAVSPDVLNQFPAAPVPTLTGFPMPLPGAVSQQPLLPAAPPGSLPLSMGPSVLGMNVPAPAPAGGAAAQPSGAFLPAFPPAQVVKPEDDDFQEFQDASKSGSLDDSFSDFQGDGAGSSKAASAQHRSSKHVCCLSEFTINLPKSRAYNISVLFPFTARGKLERTSRASGYGGDKYSAFRELEQPSESKYLGKHNLGEFKPAGADDGFTDFKTADSISPLEPPAKDKTFPTSFPSLPVQAKQQTQAKTSLNLADLDLFSSTGENKQPSFPPAFNTTKSGSFPPPPLPSTTAQPAPGKSSSLADDFGEFNLFGEFSNCASASGQDDFADFMAFNNSSGFSEQKPDDKYNALKLEASPVAQCGSSAGAVKSGQSSVPTAAPTNELNGKESHFNPLVSTEHLAWGRNPLCASRRVGRALICAVNEKLSNQQHQYIPITVGRNLCSQYFAGLQVGALHTLFRVKTLAGIIVRRACKCRSCDCLPVPFSCCSSSALASLLGASETRCIRLNISQKSGFCEGSNRGNVWTGLFLCGGFEGTLVAQAPDRCCFLVPLSPPGVPAASQGFQVPLWRGPAGKCVARESTDDFGEFQSEKPKISKFDFLVATSQGKVKSSEEMIRSELATFDLSVQGSHKRSLSLGDREISRSSPLPVLEQPFRDRSNTLSEKPALPVIRDKYRDLTGEVEESERYAYEWQRCLESALQVIKKANDTLNGISSSSVCTEVIQSAQGMEYLLGVVEVYRVTKRVELGIKATAVCSEKLQQLLKDIDKVWNNLISFMSLAALTPDENSLDFSSCMLRPGIKNAQDLACGVCLLNVDSRSKKEEKPVEELPRKAFNSETDNFKLAYGGHQYHASCANFWINCVEPKPPGLILPDLL
ncbi:SYNRG protein, partial [Columbina picui]|nr:SYNRG protein [Columbina picui]